MSKVLLIDEDHGYLTDETRAELDKLGFHVAYVGALDSVRLLPTEPDRRFTVAVAAMQGLLSKYGIAGDEAQRGRAVSAISKASVSAADALLKELGQ